ncbi:MAG: TPR end-of-group domain-containing protein, partial [Planctomycetota bacterium]
MFDYMGPTKKRPSRRRRAYAGPRSVFAEVSFREFYFEKHSPRIFSKLGTRMPSGQLFELDFYEAILGKRPEHIATLEAIGHLYTELGEHEKGLGIDKRIVKLKPRSAVAQYNLACSFSLLQMPGRALTALRRAVDLGYDDWEHLEKDTDLANLRADGR